MIKIDNSTFSCKPLKTREKPIKKKVRNCLHLSLQECKNTMHSSFRKNSYDDITILSGPWLYNFKNMNHVSKFPHKIRNKTP